MGARRESALDDNISRWSTTEKRQRDLAALARAGFAYDIARRVIDHDTAADLAELIAKANL